MNEQEKYILELIEVCSTYDTCMLLNKAIKAKNMSQDEFEQIVFKLLLLDKIKNVFSIEQKFTLVLNGYGWDFFKKDRHFIRALQGLKSHYLGIGFNPNADKNRIEIMDNFLNYCGDNSE